MESQSSDALKEVELDVPIEGWKIDISIWYPYDVIAEVVQPCMCYLIPMILTN
jgi:hypothetical protein